MLSKSRHYYYNYAAIAEPVADYKTVQQVRNRRDVWQINTVPYKGGHFAAYPPKLVEVCLLAGCPSDGTVLDPFIGSGTTAAVAKRLGRHYIGIELNPEYCILANERIVTEQKTKN